jgi:membrane-associated phospholipid phosphatase
MPILSTQTPVNYFWRTWSFALFVWAMAMILLSPEDLEVSKALLNRSSAFAQIVSSFGEWPAWAVVLSLVGILWFRRKETSSWRHPALCLSVLLQAFLHPLLISQGFKYLWGRVRFIQLTDGFAGYTPFYIPAGPGAGESFPSGHVAMALSLAPIPFYLMKIGNKKAAFWSLLAIIGYGGLVGFGRIQAGAHYLTDCLFSAGVAFLLAPIVTRIFSNPPPVLSQGS